MMDVNRRQARYSPADQSIANRVRRKLQYSIYRQKWNIAATPYSVSVVAGLEGRRKQQKALDDLRWMDERRDFFAADPFIIRKPGTASEYLIFYEHLSWRTNRGRIDCVDFKDGQFGAVRVCLESPYHLSYPHVLLDEGQIAILPEHSASKDLSIYRVNERGVADKKTTIGRHLDLVDSTLLFHGDRHWLFCTHAGAADKSELHIYHAETVFGPWRPHERNPVKTDLFDARPAGAFIRHGGELFRPAQDCRSHYGAGVVVNRVTRLTESEFVEEQVSEVRPKPGSRYDYGLHTISSAGEYTAIDGARIESSIHPRLDRFGHLFRPRPRAAA
ncbi:MAG: hypothetical protein IPG62_04030 [Sphingomonadales bacterium]|nr:hypothetical protein [Sphingomonadales bacterium]